MIQISNPDERVFEPDDNWVLPDTIVGIEVEYEGCNWCDEGFGKHWDVTGDGSLRGHGKEFISLPVFGKDLTDAIDELEQGIGNAFTAEVNYRTGIHVHLDVTDMEPDQLLSLLVLYSAYEKVLFNYHGADRDQNPYCVPYYNNPNALHFAGKLGHPNITRSVVQRVAHCTDKYAALNLRPLVRQGSVEFRHALSTLHMAELRAWIQIIMSLKKAALEFSAYEAVEKLYSDTEPFSEHVFGDYIREFSGDYVQEVESCLHVAKELSTGVNLYDLLEKLEGECTHPGFLKLREKYPYSRENRESDMIHRVRDSLIHNHVNPDRFDELGEDYYEENE
jgi:hypothetical protein